MSQLSEKHSKIPKSKWLGHNYNYYTRQAETEEDFQKVFRIRYIIFHDELNEAPFSEEGLDYDNFDKNGCADYILLCVKETDEIVGLYRIMPNSKATPDMGYYYTNIEFNLSAVIDNPKYANYLSDLGQIGRAHV